MLKKGFSIVILGQFILSWVDPISFHIAENLGEGNVSSLNYASKIILLFMALGAMATSRAILPVFSNTERKMNQRLRLAIQWSTFSFVGGLAATVVVFLLAPEIVRTIYERGAFDSTDTTNIAIGVKLGALQFPFYFSGVVQAQFFLSLGYYRLILQGALLAFLAKLFFTLLLAPSMGYSGIMLATVPMYMATNILFTSRIIRMSKNT